MTQNKTYANKESNTKEDFHKDDIKQFKKQEISNEKQKVDVKISDEDKMNASKEIFENNETSKKQFSKEKTDEQNITRKEKKISGIKNHKAVENSSLYNVLVLQTRSL